jgi:predicted small lipoprotein YifL
MVHPFKNLFLCAGVLLVVAGCGQKGPLFLKKQQSPEPTVIEQTETTNITTNENTRDESAQPSGNINNINAE